VARPVTTPHHIVEAGELPQPRGYAHAVVSEGGRIVHLAGMTAQGRDGTIDGSTLVEQFDVAAQNVVHALRAAGAEPRHMVSLVVYTTDFAQYRASRAALGGVWRQRFGGHYPAMAVIGVTELFDAAALVELMAVAVVR